MAHVWEGTHIWIWQPWMIFDGDRKAILSKLKELGATGAIVKYSDGNLVGDPVSQRFMSEFQRLVSLLKAEGFVVGGWTYQYLTDVEGEVDAFKQAVEAGADWIVLDAEVNVKGKDMQVRQYGQKVRAMYPNLPIGLSSFAIANYHPEVPWNEYMAFVDVALPQIYWAEMQWDVAVAFHASIASYKKFGKPIAPTGQAYGTATRTDMARFVQLCQQAGFSHVSWWDMQHCTADHFAGIKENPIRPSAPFLVPVSSSPVPSQIANDVPGDAWFAKAAAYALQQGILGKDAKGNFYPDQLVTRAMLAQAFYNLYHKKIGRKPP